MYSRKGVGPRMEPWGTPALTGYSREGFPTRTTQNRVLLKEEEIGLNILPEKAKSLGYIKYYSSSSPRTVKSPSNSFRNNCEKICSWSGKRLHFSTWSTILLFTSFSKALLTTERRLTER